MIAKKIIGGWLRLRQKIFIRTRAINVCDQLVKSNKIIIYMPNRVEEFGAALKSLENLRSLQPEWEITVITKLEMVSFLDSKLKVDIIPYSNEDLNFFGLPKSSLKGLIQNKAYDLFLDFKLKFDVLCVLLLMQSGAPLRACFNNKEKSDFYNFEIRINPSESLTNKYNSMVKYITTIADSKPSPQKSKTPKKQQEVN